MTIIGLGSKQLFVRAVSENKLESPVLPTAKKGAFLILI
jgi:hypothetical protein